MKVFSYLEYKQVNRMNPCNIIDLICINTLNKQTRISAGPNFYQEGINNNRNVGGGTD
jgi:hypothetical protein